MTINATHAHLMESGAPVRASIPELWRRARDFLAVIFAEHGDTRTQLFRPTITPRQRNAIMQWLKPAERFARQLLVVAAITHLLMTEQGARQRATAKPITPPTPPAPPRRSPFIDTGIDLSASIAKHVNRQPQKPARQQAKTDPDDPATWRAPFGVLRWLGAGGGGGPPPRHGPSNALQAHRRLIRRIEALRRVIEDPSQRIRRLAAYIARLPKGLLAAAGPIVRHRNKPLPHLRENLFAIWEHIDTAIEAIDSS